LKEVGAVMFSVCIVACCSSWSANAAWAIGADNAAVTANALRSENVRMFIILLWNTRLPG